MATMDELQGLRKRLVQRIQAERDPRKKADYEKRHQDVRSQIQALQRQAAQPAAASGGAGAPNPADPIAVLREQERINSEANARDFSQNNPNIVTDLGSRTVERGADGTVTVRDSMSPEQKDLYNRQMGTAGATWDLAGRLAGNISGNRLSYDGAPEMRSFDLSGAPNVGRLSYDGVQDVQAFDPSVLPGVQRLNANNLPGLTGFNAGALPRVQNLSSQGLGNLNEFDAGVLPKYDALSYDGLTALQGVGDFSADRQRVEDAVYQNLAKKLDKRFAQEENDFAQSLANRGINPGSPLYNQQMSEFRNSKSDAYGSASIDALLQGRDEQKHLFDTSLSARKQGVGERDALFKAEGDRRGYFADEQVTQNNMARLNRAQLFGERQNISEFQKQMRELGADEQALGNDMARANRAQMFNERSTVFDADRGLRNDAAQEQLNRYNSQMGIRQQQGLERQNAWNADITLRDQYGREEQGRVDSARNMRNQFINERNTLHSQPYQDFASVMANAQGAQQPNLQPYQGGETRTADVLGWGQGYAGLAQNQNQFQAAQKHDLSMQRNDQAFKAAEGAKDRAQQLALSRRGGGGGGGGMVSSAPQYVPPILGGSGGAIQQKQPGFFGQLGQNILGIGAQGAGLALGNAVGNAFSGFFGGKQ